MPLLTSPIDSSTMRPIRRYGIELDVCPKSGGVWLDKGELDKLISLVSDEASAADTDRSRGNARDEDDDDDFASHRRHDGMRRSRFMDIFD